jgi:hypothetical protein
MQPSGLTTLGDLGTRQVVVAFCEPCDRFSTLNTRSLIARFGPRLTLDELKARLCCARCGKRSRTIRIVYSIGRR